MAADRSAEIERSRVEFSRARRAQSAGRQLQVSSRRAYEMLRAGLRAGHFDGPEELAENTLVNTLGISRNSVRRALSMLADEGLVTRAPRRGTTVRRGIVQVHEGEMLPRELHEEESWRRLEIEEISQCVVPTTRLLRERLEIDDAEVVMIEQVFRLDGEPLCVRAGYVPLPATPERYFADVVAIDRRPPRYEALFEQLFDAPYGGGRAVVEAVPCEERTARLLGVTPGTPVLLREVVVRDSSGRARDLHWTHFRGDRVALSFGVDAPTAARASAPAASARVTGAAATGAQRAGTMSARADVA
ncbi:GntR family transcriptional regulator [Frankia sp. CcI49]|uniref:GntR family transcriptional regulator n=1 Tax=Frankia sp. CcI49 TaxID=1745382 RepID=UPI000976C039|nr:GntR family transcriptional regulator [Frankia sp. CcI49]ONH51746.1 GntR family transcriptional regulator [Frankia sp. CcI49]